MTCRTICRYKFELMLGLTSFRYIQRGYPKHLSLSRNENITIFYSVKFEHFPAPTKQPVQRKRRVIIVKKVEAKVLEILTNMGHCEELWQ